MTAADAQQQDSMTATVFGWVGPDRHAAVRTVAVAMHKARSLHLHELGQEDQHEGACRYCLYDAGIAVKALMRDGHLLPRTAEDGGWHWHLLEVAVGQHPLDGASTVLHEVVHHSACAHLPAGAVCWLDHDERRHAWPTEPGTYRMRPMQTEVRTDGEPDGVQDWLEIEKLGEDGLYAPFTGPAVPPHAWAMWGRRGELVALGVHRPGQDGWHSLGTAPGGDGVTLEPLDRDGFDRLSIMARQQTEPYTPGLRERFHAPAAAPEPAPVPMLNFAIWSPTGALIAVRGSSGLLLWHEIGRPIDHQNGTVEEPVTDEFALELLAHYRHTLAEDGSRERLRQALAHTARLDGVHRSVVAHLPGGRALAASTSRGARLYCRAPSENTPWLHLFDDGGDGDLRVTWFGTAKALVHNMLMPDRVPIDEAVTELQARGGGVALIAWRKGRRRLSNGGEYGPERSYPTGWHIVAADPNAPHV